MKLRIEIPSIIADLEIYEEDQEEFVAIDSLLKGEVILSEEGLSMNLLSEDARKKLINNISDGILNFVLDQLHINEEGA